VCLEHLLPRMLEDTFRNSKQSQPSQHQEAPVELISIRQLKTAYIIRLVLSTMGIIPNRLHKSLKLLNLHPALYILVQKAEVLNTCRIVRMFLTQH
jgi:hypothetical protein